MIIKNQFKIKGFYSLSRYIYKYEHNISPFAEFFKILAKKPTDAPETTINRLQCWIPDTIILRDQDIDQMYNLSILGGYILIIKDLFIEMIYFLNKMLLKN